MSQGIEAHRRDIAGVPISELAAQFGTPTYFYDADRIVRQLQHLQAFDVIRYAQKANSHLAILDLMRRNHVLLDAVSAGELWRAAAAGYSWVGDPHPVVYTADVFDAESFQLVVDFGVHVNCGSPDMIDQLGQSCPGRAISVRINPGFGHGHSRKTNTGGPQSKHGIWHEDLNDIVARCRRYDLTIAGVHMHIGSGSDFDHLGSVCEAMESVAIRLGEEVQTISAGGGLPTPYHPDDRPIDVDRYYEMWEQCRQRIARQLGHAIRLEVEPGRYPVAEAGYLLTEIRAIKRMGPNLFYLVDAGFNNLARPVLYGAYHPISLATRSGLQPTTWETVVVGGPLCESGDIFTQGEGGTVLSRALPTAHVGDWLVIECAGAYGFSMSSNYNSKPLAAEVLISGQRSSLIRQRQDVRMLFADERIPADISLEGERSELGATALDCG